MIEGTNYYIRQFNEISDRDDFVYYHPSLDSIKAFRDSSVSFPFSTLVKPNGVDYGVTKSGKDEGIYEFVNIQNLDLNGTINRTNLKYVDEAPTEKLLKTNQVLISRSRLVGRAAKVTNDFEGATFGSYIIRFKLREDIDYNIEFLVRFLNSKFGQQQMMLLKTGSTGGNINSGQLMDVRLPKIALPQQQKIMQQVILIEAAADQLELQSSQKRETANEVLITELGFEQPKETHYFFKSGTENRSIAFYEFASELADRLHFMFYHPKYIYLNELSKKYKTTILESACREPIRLGEQVKEDETGAQILLKTANLKNDSIDFDNTASISTETLKLNSGAQAHNGDILLAATGYVSMGKVDIYDRDLPALIDGQIAIIRLNEEYDPYFMTYFLRSHFGQLQIEKWWIGSSGQIHLPPADIAKFVIISCQNLPREKQSQIAEKITDGLTKARELDKEVRSKRDEAKRTFEQLVLNEITV